MNVPSVFCFSPLCIFFSIIVYLLYTTGGRGLSWAEMPFVSTSLPGLTSKNPILQKKPKKNLTFKIFFSWAGLYVIPTNTAIAT